MRNKSDKKKKVRMEAPEELAEAKEEGASEDVKNEVDDIMKDHEKFANIQKLLSESNDPG